MIKTALTEWTPLEWAALCLGRELYLGTELFGASGNCITNSSAFACQHPFHNCDSADKQLMDDAWPCLYLYPIGWR